MADENKLSISDFLEDDGSLDGVIRQLNDIVELVDMLEGLIKKDKVGEWMRSLKQGSLDYKVALSGATALAERLVTISTKLVGVRSEEAKEIARLEAIVKSENRERQREVELNQQTVGSYARLKLELKKLIEDYKAVSTESANYAQEKSRIAAQIADVTAKISIEDKTLKVLVNDYNSYTEAQKAALAELERRKIASDAAVKATKDLIASEEKLKSVRTQASTTTESGRSQIAEIKYNDELAASIKKVEEARAQADFMRTEEYQRQIAAQEKLRQEQLELVAGMKLEEITAESNSGTYAQLEARYKLVEDAMKKLQYSADGDNSTLDKLKSILDSLGISLDGLERKMGVTSSRMSSRQRQWNGLTNSVYQLSREIPNLAVRADTFFLAISNNIPIFIDEFKRAKMELGSFRKALVETGKAFAKSIPLALILLALSKFSELKKVAESLFGTLEDGTLKAGYAYQHLADAVGRNTKKFAEQMVVVGALKRKWDSLTSVEERERFLLTYRDELDKTGFAITKVNEAENFFEQATGKVVQSFVARAQAAAAMEAATAKYEEAMKKMAIVEEKATKLMGKPTTIADIQNMFLDEYGLGKDALLPNGKIAVSPEQLKKIASDYEAYVIADYYGRIPAGVKNIEARDRMKENVAAGRGQELSYGDYSSLSILKALGEVQGVGTKRQLRVAAQDLDELFAQAEQFGRFYEMFIGQGKSAEEAIEAASKAVADLDAKVQKLKLDSLKFLNDKKLDAINNQTYLRGDSSVTYGSVKIDESGNVAYGENDVTNNLQSSFDKARYGARLGLDEINQEIQTKVAEGQKLLRETTDEGQKESIQQSIANYEAAGVQAAQAYIDGLLNTDAEEKAAMARVYADNVAMRLEAVKEGSDEELDLRIESIRANMNAEIAENAMLEKKQQRSVSAIRAKYRREEEQAKRDHFIKMANYRKKDLENEQSYVNEYTQSSLVNKVDMEYINLQIELAENSDLIEKGLISREDIIKKYNKRIERIYLDHRAKILQAAKSYWDMMAEFVTDGSYEQLEAQLTKYDLELKAEKLQYKELIEVMPEYGRMLDEIYAKRKRLATGQYNLSRFDAQQDIDATIFGSRQQIGEQQQSIFDLRQEWARDTYQLELFDNGQLDLTDDQLDAIYADLRRIANEMKQITGWRGKVSRVADNGLAGLLRMPDRDDTGKRKKDANGKDAWRDLSSEEYDTISTYMSNLKDSINGVMQAYVDLAQAAYDAAQAQVDAARTVYETELEARANGYANDVEGAKRELALEKQKAKKKEEILKSAQKAQEHFNTLTQISDLITASASILKIFAAVPAVAAIMLASMWGMFAYAKIKASQVANTSSVYGEGGYELAVGGSHASGHDIHTNIQTKSGRQMVIEGGEGVGILSRKAVNQYGDLIPQVIDSLNDGSFGVSGMGYDDISAINNAKYAKEVLSLQPIMNRVDLSTIEGLISVLISKQTGMPIVLQDGSLLERKGNKTIITKKG